MKPHCPCCDAPMNFMVHTVVIAPGELFHKFTKAAYRRGDVHLSGVLWETADMLCTNHECGHVINGYGNYVTNLQKRVAALEAKLEARTE